MVCQDAAVKPLDIKGLKIGLAVKKKLIVSVGQCFAHKSP